MSPRKRPPVDPTSPPADQAQETLRTIEPVARLLGLSLREVREALARLVKDGDFVRTWEGRCEWYRLNIRYP